MRFYKKVVINSSKYFIEISNMITPCESMEVDPNSSLDSPAFEIFQYIVGSFLKLIC